MRKLILPAVACLLAATGCATKNIPFGNRTYYSFSPDKQINQIRFSRDNVDIKTLSRDLEEKPDSRSTFKVLEVKENDRKFILYLKRTNIKPEPEFATMSIRVEDASHLLVDAGSRPCKTLVECKEKIRETPKDNLEITLYASEVFDSLKYYRKIADLDSSTICLINRRARERVTRDDKKIQNISKYDMYLSSTKNEIQSRMLMDLRINPIDFTNEEMIDAMKKCAEARQ